MKMKDIPDDPAKSDYELLPAAQANCYANNRLDRDALPAPVLEQPPPGRPKDPQTTETERRLLTMLREACDLKSLGVEDNFFDLGGDSLLAVGMFARIEYEFGLVLSLDVLFERPTIRLLADLIEHPPTDFVRSTVVTIQAGHSRPPLFCLPGIGGNVLEFRGLADHLDPAQRVFALPPVGLDDDRAPYRTIEDMAAHAVEQVRSVQPDGPYQLAGYSLGGVVAFDMARQLRAAGQTVGLVALLDSQLWSPPMALSIWQKLRLHWQNVRRNSNAVRRHYLRARWQLFVERIRRGNFRRAEDDLIEGLALSSSSRKVARVHWQAWRNYEPGIYDGTLTLFVAQQDPSLRNTANDLDPTRGWARWTTRPVEIHLTTATHLEIVRAKELQVLKTQLRAAAVAPEQVDCLRQLETS
jgi:thioesterase domain-containing protein/acyl carrier protein